MKNFKNMKYCSNSKLIKSFIFVNKKATKKLHQDKLGLVISDKIKF
jgi:hypothetical protein